MHLQFCLDDIQSLKTTLKLIDNQNEKVNNIHNFDGRTIMRAIILEKKKHTQEVDSLFEEKKVMIEKHVSTTDGLCCECCCCFDMDNCPK